MRRPRAASSGMSLMMSVVFPDPLHPTMPKILARFIYQRYMFATKPSLAFAQPRGSRGKALRARIDVALPFPQETHQRESGGNRKIDGEARRGADGREYRDTRSQRLLYQFETCPPAQHDNVLLEQQPPGQEILAHQLVECVVTPDILGNRD